MGPICIQKTWISSHVARTKIIQTIHDGVIKWKYFPRYWPFVRGIHRSSVNSPHKGQWRGAVMFSLICVWINGWVNNREAGDLRRHRTHCDVIVMLLFVMLCCGLVHPNLLIPSYGILGIHWVLWHKKIKPNTTTLWVYQMGHIVWKGTHVPVSFYDKDNFVWYDAIAGI